MPKCNDVIVKPEIGALHRYTRNSEHPDSWDSFRYNRGHWDYHDNVGLDTVQREIKESVELFFPVAQRLVDVTPVAKATFKVLINPKAEECGSGSSSSVSWNNPEVAIAMNLLFNVQGQKEYIRQLEISDDGIRARFDFGG